jgi:chaperonin GroES
MDGAAIMALPPQSTQKVKVRNLNLPRQQRIIHESKISIQLSTVVEAEADSYKYKKEATVASFVPLGERVIVKPIEQEQTTRGGIFLPDTAKEKPQEGEVVAVGPGRMSDDGKRISMELAKGDRVVYSKFAGTEYKDGDEEYLILRESDILAKVS